MPINNLSDLRRELCDSIDRVKKDRAYIPQATEITNAAGKIINSLRVELEYAKVTRTPPRADPFLLGVVHVADAKPAEVKASGRVQLPEAGN